MVRDPSWDRPTKVLNKIGINMNSPYIDNTKDVKMPVARSLRPSHKKSFESDF